MSDPLALEDRLNPLFPLWVDLAPGAPPEFAALRLEGLRPEESRTLVAVARDAQLLPADGRETGRSDLLALSGPGPAFRTFLDAARTADDFTALAAPILWKAYDGRRALLARPYALAEGVTLEPGRVQIWGVVNVTPDSFSDGGRCYDPKDALAQAVRMADEGADVIDVGGESTRPGAAPVGEAEERSRVLPVIESIRAETDVPVSIDTAKASVAREALAAGAAVVNDVTGLRGDPDMAGVVAEAGAGAVVMHMRGTPRTMQEDPRYEDLFGEIARSLRRSLALLEKAGGAGALVDPGIGFGKTLAHNLLLIRHLGMFGALGRPILLGPSRKSFLGALLDLPVEERLEGTAAAVAAGVMAGAAAVRVHDVREMRRVARVAAAVAGAGGEGP
ncbi:MAG: dihydropteroate synthase [Planctomycetota bacterium]|jgi:dihydropteroate synthase